MQRGRRRRHISSRSRRALRRSSQGRNRLNHFERWLGTAMTRPAAPSVFFDRIRHRPHSTTHARSNLEWTCMFDLRRLILSKIVHSGVERSSGARPEVSCGAVGFPQLFTSVLLAADTDRASARPQGVDWPSPSVPRRQIQLCRCQSTITVTFSGLLTWLQFNGFFELDRIEDTAGNRRRHRLDRLAGKDTKFRKKSSQKPREHRPGGESDSSSSAQPVSPANFSPFGACKLNNNLQVALHRGRSQRG